MPVVWKQFFFGEAHRSGSGLYLILPITFRLAPFEHVQQENTRCHFAA
jgi:hypothetical protein